MFFVQFLDIILHLFKFKEKCLEICVNFFIIFIATN